MSNDAADMVINALRRAWTLGQAYYYQAHSEFYGQNKKSDETKIKFETLIEEKRAALSQPAPRGVEEVMETARRLTFADTESVLSAETEGWWAKHDKACAIARELEHAITAVITERDTLRAGVVTLRSKVQELQGHQWSPSSPGLVVRSEVLALIDKMGGKV